MTEKLLIKDKENRGSLVESRSYQMGFAFLKKTNDCFETVQPISTCKDYLNDIVWSEHVNKPVLAYGLKYTKQGIFNGKTSYMVIKILNYMTPAQYIPYTNFEAHKQGLSKNYINIETLLNWVEHKLGIENSKVIKAKNDMYLVEMPYFWSSSTYLISIYSLLIRMAQFWDGNATPAEFLNSYNNPLDIILWMQYKPKLLLMLAGHKIEQTLDPATGPNIHNEGMGQYKNFKFKE